MTGGAPQGIRNTPHSVFPNESGPGGATNTVDPGPNRYKGAAVQQCTQGPKCGTHLGRSHHRKRNEQMCEPCRLAWNAHCRADQAARRASGYVRPGRNPKPKRNVDCTVCGEPIIRTGKCGDEPRHKRCRPEQFWANAIQISDVGRRAIYDRDGWVCQICHEPVDRELQFAAWQSCRVDRRRRHGTQADPPRCG